MDIYIHILVCVFNLHARAHNSIKQCAQAQAHRATTPHARPYIKSEKRKYYEYAKRRADEVAEEDEEVGEEDDRETEKKKRINT